MADELEINNQRLTIGRGTIGPGPHIKNDEYGWDLFNRAVTDLTNDDSLYFKVESIIPLQCGDGRSEKLLGPSAIGGTFSLVMGDSLGPKKYLGKIDNAKSHSKKIYEFLIKQGFSIGGHDDDHASFFACGCGGEDKLNDIIGFISSNGDDLKDFIESLIITTNGKSMDIEVPDDIHQRIVLNASELSAKQYVTNGSDLRQSMIEIGGVNSIDTLHGEHKEIAAVLDFRPYFSLDRAKFSHRYNDIVQSFYVNVACLKQSSETIYVKPSDQQLAFLAMVYYNVAATAILANDSLGIITLI